ncbi:hypothetical protein [Sphingobacterium sp. UGAL515B_05]|uniref:hypothetical protein n=1 Tax=Sphingobacterium sp. UGAL515B_05 TaxID=2986767 RepID=UPI002954BC04|nr:hypothetical protein [Sphingobacterium sp. UGAL515B_05]WON93664.1 hypothetical protein OK025_20750 [Sphingobacterium sp. UGAL515B_05]
MITLKKISMKKIFNKIGQVLQLLLTAPVKLPGKVGNVLKYLALGLGIVETVLDEAKPQSEVDDGKQPLEGKDNPVDSESNRSALGETMSSSVLPTDNDPSESAREDESVKNGTENPVERSATDEME